MRLVADASVVIKWFVPEVHSAEATRWLDAAPDLAAPDLLFAEIASVVWKKVGRRELTEAQARAIASGVERLPFRCLSSRELHGSALELALATRRSVYDCLYLATALVLGAPLLTADRKLYDALAVTPLRDHLRWVTAAPD